MDRVSYVITGGNTHGSFDMDKTTGDLYVAKLLDYETTPSYTLEVKLFDYRTMTFLATTVTIQVDMIDVNDERPSFPNDPVMLTVAENSKIGVALWNFTAPDKDSGLNGIVHYHIVNRELTNDMFIINALTGTLYLQGPLDYEMAKSHMIVICATDQSIDVNSRLNSTVTAQIIVQDENDNAPVFVSASKISVYELEPVGSVVHTLSASDLDANDNGKVFYSIAYGNEQEYFELNGESGELGLLKPLKREQVELITLNVTANDHGSPPNFSSQMLRISVEAVNNSPPQVCNVLLGLYFGCMMYEHVLVVRL